MDLFYLRGGKRYGVEVKFTGVPGITKSMVSAKNSLALEHLYVLTLGAQTWPLSPWATVIGLQDLPRVMQTLPGLKA